MSNHCGGQNMHPFLQGLRPEWIAAIDECSVNCTLRAGQFLVRSGTSATRIHLLSQGHIGLELVSKESPAAQISVMGPGDLLARPCSTQPRFWQFSARAIERVETQSVLVKRLHQACETDRELARELSHRLVCALTEQLDATRRQVAEASRLAWESQRFALESLGQLHEPFAL
jgi:CRP-like cAMP-binding protein